MPLYGTRQLADGMRAVRTDTLLIAADIPESQYHYRPTPESRSVAETLVHITWLASFDRFVHEEAHLDSLEAIDFGAVIKQSEAEEKRRRSKADIVELLRTEGDRWVRWVEQLPDALLSARWRFDEPLRDAPRNQGARDASPGTAHGPPAIARCRPPLFPQSAGAAQHGGARVTDGIRARDGRVRGVNPRPVRRGHHPRGTTAARGGQASERLGDPRVAPGRTSSALHLVDPSIVRSRPPTPDCSTGRRSAIYSR